MARAEVWREEGGKTGSVRVYQSYDIRDTLQERGYRFRGSTRDAGFERRFGLRSGDDAYWHRDGLDNDDIMREWAVLRELGVEAGDTLTQRMEANWEAVAAHIGLA